MRGVPQPSREEVLGYPQLHVSQHPVVAHKLTLLRRADTKNKQFTELVAELSWLLGYEAMADLPLHGVPIRTPLEDADGFELGEKIGLVPILRAGLGMVCGFRELMPRVQVWHLGLYRNERTLQQLVQHYPDVDIHVAALDRELNERGYILPGLGDAGDRQFGTAE